MERGAASAWVTLDEAANYFAVSRRTLDKRIAAGGLPVLRIGRVVRIDLVAAEMMLTREDG